MVICMMVYGVLTWYFDHVIGDNRGTNESFYFFLQKKYWSTWRSRKSAISSRKRRKLKRQRERAGKLEKLLGELNDLEVVDSVTEEKHKVMQLEKDGLSADGLRVAGLKKTYNKYPFGITSKKDTKALKGVYLDIPDNELLTILGHNGAGKSTLIGVLTGILAPSDGSAKLCNFDLEDDLEEIRNIIGVVPQFDILWDNLTAEEHMRMFCKIKGVPERMIPDITDKNLKSVNLIDVKRSRVSTFSGGMKRRLTVAISCIGDP